MKKIVLALVVAVVACVVVFASQDAKCRQAAVYSSFEQVTPDGFRRIDMQNLPYKIEIGNPDRSEEFVLMNGRGEVIK